MIDLETVKLDLDREPGQQPWSLCRFGKWAERAAKVFRALDTYVRVVEVEETRGGYHVRFEVSPPLPSSVHLVAVQAMMGSDSSREALNLARQIRGEPRNWNTLSRAKVRDGVLVPHIPAPDMENTVRRRLVKAGVFLKA